MVSFKGYDEVIRRVYDHHQEHLFQHWDILHDSEKRMLLDDVKEVDFDLIDSLFRKTSARECAELRFSPPEYRRLLESEEAIALERKAHEAGVAHIKKGKVAAFLVAGGQGTRLGFDGPKGAFPVGPVSGKSLFQIHAEKIIKYSEKYGVTIPWLIMTSIENHGDTVAFFEKHYRFGIEVDDLFIFHQNMIPSLDENGRIILKDRTSIFKNPDGHGGSLTALHSSGVLRELARRGIETISYFQVDNPMVRIIDPAFIGHHLLEAAEVSSKGIRKIDPGEKVGVFVRFENGKTGIIEYSDLSPEKQREHDASGELAYCMANPAIHLFRRDFIEELNSGGPMALPYHIAKKRITVMREGGELAMDAYKFEKFVFDAIPLARKTVVIETRRDEEFAPVKNATGADSVETAQDLMSRLAFRWCAHRRIAVPPQVRVIEISPLHAVEPDDLSAVIPAREKVYIE